MRFQYLQINDAFISGAYPEAVFIKTRLRAATCCTAAQNAKMISLVNDVPVEKAILLDDDLDVTQLTDGITLKTLQDVGNFKKAFSMVKVVEEQPLVEPKITEYSHIEKLTVAPDGGLQNESGALVKVEGQKIVSREPISSILKGGGTW